MQRLIRYISFNNDSSNQLNKEVSKSHYCFYLQFCSFSFFDRGNVLNGDEMALATFWYWTLYWRGQT